MSYTVRNYKTKKSLKEAISNGDKVRCYQPGLGPDLSTFTGTIYLEGPHYPAPHTWYAQGMMINGVLTSVK